VVDLADEPDPAVVDGGVRGRSIGGILAAGDLDDAARLAAEKMLTR